MTREVPEGRRKRYGDLSLSPTASQNVPCNHPLRSHVGMALYLKPHKKISHQ